MTSQLVAKCSSRSLSANTNGLLTLLVGILAYGVMPPAPTKSIIRRSIQGRSTNRQPVNWTNLCYSLSNNRWPIYIIGFTFLISTSSCVPWISAHSKLLLMVFPNQVGGLLIMLLRCVHGILKSTMVVYNMVCQLGGILTNYIYRNDDPPVQAGQQGSICLCSEFKENYLATTIDRGNKRLDFRFAH
ncbi:hypothetical protein V1524DRAFT_450379 [Lipomyces starkeyi]